MEKYLEAIKRASERMQMYYDCRVRACSRLGRPYESRDALEMYQRSEEICQGIKLVAMSDDEIGPEGWREIVEKCEKIISQYYDDYDAMIKKMLEEL